MGTDKINCFEQEVAEVAEAAEKEPDRDGGFFGREEAQKSRRGRAATKNELPQKIAKIAKKKLHKFLSLCSLRSFVAKIFLELHDSSLLHRKRAASRGL